MAQILKSISTKTILQYIPLGGISLLILVNAYIAWLYIFNKPLDADEFQHVHIVWNMFYNQKTIYRDFWEHHGVVYPAINYLLFKVFNLQATFTTYFFLRGIGLFYMAAFAVLTYKIAAALFKDKLVSLLSVAILTSLFFFNLKGIEIRPDTLQNVFWLAGLYICIVRIQKFQGYSFFISGILFGLAICTNAKAVFCVVLVLMFLFGQFVLLKNQRTENIIKIGKMCGGIFLVHALVLLYFFMVGGAYAYFESNFLFNFIEITRESNEWVFPYFWNFFVDNQFPFIATSVIGTVLFIAHMRTHNSVQKTFFIFITLGSSLGALFGLYPQLYLMFLPLLSIVSSYGMVTLVHYVSNQNLVKTICLCVLLCLFFLPMEKVLFSRLQLFQTDISSPELARIFIDSTTIDDQLFNTNFILGATERTEAVGYFWNSCGGFTFNEDPQYYWTYTPLHSDTSIAVAGYDPYAESFVQALQEKDIRYLVGRDTDIRLLYASSTAQYIADNYRRINDCILVRN